MNRPGIPPALVAFLRGAAEAAILAVIGVAIVALGDVTAGELAPWAPLGILALRQLEGLADQAIDPTKQRVTGGAPVAQPAGTGYFTMDGGYESVPSADDLARKHCATTATDVANALAAGTLTEDLPPELCIALSRENVRPDDDPDDTAGWSWRDGEPVPD